MKKQTTIQILIISLFLIFSHQNFAQKLEKIKGSKIVTLTEVELDSVTSIELYKGIDLVLKKAESDKLTIYADDNLHDVVDIDLNSGKLSLSLLKRITSKKKFELTLYASNLSLIILDDNSSLKSTDLYEVDNLNIEMNNKSVLECSFKADAIVYEGNDSSKSDCSFNAETLIFNLQDRVRVKGTADVKIAKITIDGRASINLTGKSDETFIVSKESADVKFINMKSTITDIEAEDSTQVYTQTSEDLTISAKDNAKIYIYGKPDIDLITFKGKASLFKKQ